MRRLGQHFLINRSAIKKIIEALDIHSGDTIVEIGAGHGELTREFLNESGIRNQELRIIAIEKDRRLINILTKKFIQNKNLMIVGEDIRKILAPIIHDSRFMIQTYKLVGNIPYYLAGHLLRIIGELEHKPERCVFTLQKEVAERITAKPPRMNRLAACVQFWAEPEIIGFISKKEFRPMPKVDSAIVKLIIRNQESGIRDADYYRMVKVLFRQPRKTILNNLQHTTLQPTTKEALAQTLREISINPNDRPQDLSVHDIVKISNTLGPMLPSA